MAQLVKDLVLLLLWFGFDLWPQKFCMPQARQKKKKKKKKKVCTERKDKGINLTKASSC